MECNKPWEVDKISQRISKNQKKWRIGYASDALSEL